MKFLEILLENKIDDFKSKYRTKFGDENVKRIANQVAPKFLDWVGRNFDVMDFENNFNKLVTTLDKFEKVSSNLPYQDINQYKSFSDLVGAITEWENRNRRTFQQVQGGNLVYEDDNWYVVNPLTHDASCYYGKGTKWCTAASTDVHFNNYNDEAKLFYIINKKVDNKNKFYKIALLKKFDGAEGYWDAIDETIDKDFELFQSEQFQKIKSVINQYFEKAYAEQIKIFQDKEAAEKERRRLNALRIQRENERKAAEAQERRENNEWELGPDCPDEGLKAYALLDWLKDTSDMSVITDEDRIRRTELKTRLEELEEEKTTLEAQEDSLEGEEYDNLIQRISDIEQEIQDIEEEIGDVEQKIDVYNILPTGRHYDMTSFEVIGLEGREYAVGTETETQSSAEEYVDQLLDDVGYDGFRKWFVENYIDEDQVRSYAEEFYEQDVRDNPEAFFNDDERTLSDEQNDEIEILERKISQLEAQKENYESILENLEDEEEIEDLQEKISEIEETIEETETEIEDIKNDPQGDFPQDLIDEKVKELVDDAVYDPRAFLDNWGLEITEFIDKDSFIEGVVNEDGYGLLSSYDGVADEVTIEGKTYYVVRTN